MWRVKTVTIPARPKPAHKTTAVRTEETPLPAGKHLTIDAYGIAFEKLRDSRALYNLLDDLPGLLGMRKLTTPQIAFVQHEDRTGDWGISGFVMIYESHISLHTWPENGYVSMDVYSCKDFDDKKVVGILKEFWGATKLNAHVIARG